MAAECHEAMVRPDRARVQRQQPLLMAQRGPRRSKQKYFGVFWRRSWSKPDADAATLAHLIFGDLPYFDERSGGGVLKHVRLRARRQRGCAVGDLDPNIDAFAGWLLRRDGRKWQVRTRMPTTEHIVEGSAARWISGAWQIQVPHPPSNSLAASAVPQRITVGTMPNHHEPHFSTSLYVTRE